MKLLRALIMLPWYALKVRYYNAKLAAEKWDREHNGK